MIGRHCDELLGRDPAVLAAQIDRELSELYPNRNFSAYLHGSSVAIDDWALVPPADVDLFVMVPRLDAKLFDDIRRRFSALEVRTLRMVPIFDVGPVVYPTATAPSQLALQVQIVIGQEMLSPLTQDSLQRGGSLIGGNVLNAENRPLSLSSIQRWLGWDLIFARAVTLDKTAFFWRWVSDQAPRRAFHLISLSEPRARQKATAYAARRLLEWSFVLQPVLGSNGRHVPPPTALVDLAMACQSPDEFERVWAESDQLEGIVDACLSENRALWACIRSIGRRHYSR